MIFDKAKWQHDSLLIQVIIQKENKVERIFIFREAGLGTGLGSQSRSYFTQGIIGSWTGAKVAQVEKTSQI